MDDIKPWNEEFPSIGMCVNCAREICDLWGRLTHKAADGWFNVGCRAASYVPGIGWDESLAKDMRPKL